MNREETLTLYKQGVKVWNKWANEMLEERKRLEEAGEWKVQIKEKNITSLNEKTKRWLKKAFTNFSSEEIPHIFQENANFIEFIFPYDVTFENITFQGEAHFNKSTFFGNAIFDNTIFNKHAWFDSSTFNGITSFLTVIFNGQASFLSSIFNGETTFSTTIFEQYTSFHNAQFSKSTSFHAIHSKTAFTLKGAHFKRKVPGFIQAHFEEAPRLDHIIINPDVIPGYFINSITTHFPKNIKANYQALRRLAAQALDHENEQLFWAGELRSDRSLRTEDGSWNLRPLVSTYWWGNIAYGCVSDYGRSIIKPLSALIILIGLITGLHLTVSKTPLTYDKAFSAGYISTNKSFLYLGADPTKRSIIKEKYTALYGANENQTPKIPKTILTAEFIQTLLSAIFIFLALLGIRNNFKMK